MLDAFNLVNGYENVYTATPDVTAADGTVTPGTVTDTLVTPYGNDNLSSMFAGDNAANPLQPGDAFTGLATSIAGTKDAFTIDGTTFDPHLAAGGEGFTRSTNRRCTAAVESRRRSASASGGFSDPLRDAELRHLQRRRRRCR